MSDDATILVQSALQVPDIEPMLIWTDIPYNTGKRQASWTGGYRDDNPEQVLTALVEWSHILHRNGTMVVCCDYRMAWNVCYVLNHMLYMGEIIWEFGLGRPRETWWPNRHNNLLTFVNHAGIPKFDQAAVPRTKRLAPKLGYPDDKPMGSVWEFTMSNTHPDRVGYPNQKPLEIVQPFVLAHTDAGDLVADPFCGSSTTGVAAIRHGRKYWGCDNDESAVAVSIERIMTEVERLYP